MEQAAYAFTLLDAASYRLFGGDWRHRGKRREAIDLDGGGKSVMLSGLQVSDFGKCLISFSVQGDGTRELEVHSLDRTSRRDCQGWQITQPVHTDLPALESLPFCKGAVSHIQVLPRHYEQELMLIAQTVHGLAACGGAYDVPYILNTSRSPDLLNPLRSTLEDERHDFFFEGTRQYVRFARTQLAKHG